MTKLDRVHDSSRFGNHEGSQIPNFWFFFKPRRTPKPQQFLLGVNLGRFSNWSDNQFSTGSSGVYRLCLLAMEVGRSLNMLLVRPASKATGTVPRLPEWQRWSH